MMLSTLLLCCVVGLATTVPTTPVDEVTPRDGEKCGYDSCVDAVPDALNVHIVAHTHDDVGWLKTVDQYYYGSRSYLQKAGVKYILDSVVKELWEDPKRKFIYVETAFFWKWWVAQPASVKSRVHTLVRQGRLQFVGGAWSMNDEAASHYQSTVDQFTWGLRKLNDTFGECGRPAVGWQIDPFGHSREFASNLAMMGYDGLFLGRIDYQDKERRLKDRDMETLWRGSDDLGRPSDIFTSVLYNTYSPPPGFCFDVLCSDEPIIDDSSSPMYNVEERVTEFLSRVNQMSQAYRTNNILVTMGDDFQYQDAAMWFTNLDKLIQYANLHSAKEGLNVKLFYSTPQCYLKAVKHATCNQGNSVEGYSDAANEPDTRGSTTGYVFMRSARSGAAPTWASRRPPPTDAEVVAACSATKEALWISPTLPTKQDDFFPYASDSTAFWTGYFTSRPTTKFMEREGNNFLQTFKALQVLANLPKSNMFVLNELKSAMGVMQHHDAITGTEKQHVTHDYERIMSQAVEDAFIIGSQAFNKLINSEVSLSYERCEFNQSQCSVTEESDAFVVTVYNNQVLPKTLVDVEVPVTNAAYSVYDETGTKLPSELQALSSIYFSIPTRKSTATHRLYFQIKSIPGLGFKSFFVKKEKAKQKRDANKKRAYAYYTNMNDYWKDIRYRTEVDIKNVETDSYLPKFDSNANIPDRDNKLNTVETRDYNKNLNWDVLKDGKEEDDEIKHDINEASKKLVEDSLRAFKKERKVVFQSLNDDEMRMLADDPMVVEQPQDIVLENEFITLTIDKRTGWMNYSSKSDGTTLLFLLQPGYYIGCEGNNRVLANRSSGAYIFRPNMTASPELKTFQNFNIIGVIQSPIKQEITVQYHNSATLVVGINYKIIHISSILNADEGKEYVLRIDSHLKTDGVFYTDSNGRQMLKRIRNKRPQWNLTLAEPIPGNYYPVVNEIYIEDDDVRIVLNVDRARGGASLTDGGFEIMQHRRLRRDDGFGVGEALNETAGGVGLFSIDNSFLQIVPKNKDNLLNAAVTSHALFSPAQLFVADANGLTLDKFKKMNNVYTFLETDLPTGVHLLTLEPWSDGRILIRFENYLGKSLSPETVSVDVSAIFKTIEIESLRETTLAANTWLSDYEQWEWNTENEFSRNFNEEYGGGDVERAKDTKEELDDGLTIKLKPKQIRTFIANYRVVV